MNINDFVKGINNPKLLDAVRRLGNSSEGKKILNSLSPEDKKKLIEKIGDMNSNGISQDMLLNQLNNNPDILNKINSVLKK